MVAPHRATPGLPKIPQPTVRVAQRGHVSQQVVKASTGTGAQAAHSPIRLAYKGFLLYPKAMGELSRGGAGPGSLGNPPPGFLGPPEPGSSPQSQKSKMSKMSKKLPSRCLVVKKLLWHCLVVKKLPWHCLVVKKCFGIAQLSTKCDAKQ